MFLFFATQHEMASVEMFQHLIDVNALKEEFANYKLEDEHIAFIKALIKGEMAEVQRSVLGTVTCLLPS